MEPRPLSACQWHSQLASASPEVLEKASTLSGSRKNPEIFRRLAECHLGKRHLARALECLDAAVALAPGSLVYRAERALLLRISGDAESARQEAHRCLSSEDENSRERYYRGLAFYLLGAEEPARTELRRSRVDPAFSDWPDYSDLLRSFQGLIDP